MEICFSAYNHLITNEGLTKYQFLLFVFVKYSVHLLIISFNTSERKKRMQDFGFCSDKLHEECGVFGIHSNDIKISDACFYGLLALQHRGQESCGMAVGDGGVMHYYKNMGTVTDVFTESIRNNLVGQIGIGHVRYSTTGESVPQNAQPLVQHYQKGMFALAHNGNLVNTNDLKSELTSNGAIFQTTIDTEIIAYLIARERLKSHTLEDAVKQTMPQLAGSYSLLVMSPHKLIAVRDPLGLRPLCIGKIGNSYMFASETCALDACGATFVRDVKPGEIVIVDNNGLKSDTTYCSDKKAHCVFEYIYFSRADSYLDGISVYKTRERAGEILAREFPVEADFVMGVPESGIATAIGYSNASGIPFEQGIVKNGYIGRTFIEPTQAGRKKSVRIKLNPISNLIEGKRIILLDDSIVRGTTCDCIVRLLKEAGAKEVHLRISSPMFTWPCFYGTDIPSKDELIACHHNMEEIGKISGADSIGFLPVESLGEMLGQDEKNFCDACFTGNYPIPYDYKL